MQFYINDPNNTNKILVNDLKESISQAKDFIKYGKTVVKSKFHKNRQEYWKNILDQLNQFIELTDGSVYLKIEKKEALKLLKNNKKIFIVCKNKVSKVLIISEEQILEASTKDYLVKLI